MSLLYFRNCAAENQSMGILGKNRIFAREGRKNEEISSKESDNTIHKKSARKHDEKPARKHDEKSARKHDEKSVRKRDEKPDS